MMGLGPVGSGVGGNSSSSTSNLSALAPPFTVDRLNPKPNSNPNMHYPDSPYSAEPYSRGWQYPTPSAPISELVFESAGIDNVPLSDDYRYSPLSTISPASSTHWPAANKALTSAFAYGGEVKPYYSSYGPPLVGEDSLLAEDDGTRYSVGPTAGKSQADYSSSLFDVDYRAAWVADLGFDGYGNRLDQGGFVAEKSKRKSTQDSGISYQTFNQTSDKEGHTGSSLSIAQMEVKSRLEKISAFLPYDSNKIQTSAYISTYPEPYYSAQASETHKNFSNGQNSFENFVKPVDTPFIGPVSATMPSPTVVIRPPPVNNGKFTQRTFSRKPARSDIEKSAQSLNFGSNPNSQAEEDPFDRKIKTRTGSSQLPDLDILGGFNMGCDDNKNNSNGQLVNLTENSSDIIDHLSMSVDSPCWKGASSSQFSPFSIEAGESNKNIGNEYGAIFSSKPNSVNESKTGGFEMGILDTKSLISEGVNMGLNDVSEVAVAVHVAENVLASPASQEDASDHTVIMPQDQKLNVQMVLKAIYNLSELLLFHLSSDDACSMEEESTETLRKTIGNLDSCLNNKIIEASKMMESINSVGDNSSDKPRESCELGTGLGNPHTRNEAPDSQIKLDFQHMHEEERNYSFSGKKGERSTVCSPLVDDLDITRDDDMTKAIKKVLEENFQLNEEMPSEALLFKNLWLDTEAKLCSITYKARFDRMKIQMEQLQIKAPQDNEDNEETRSEVCLSPGSIASPKSGPKGDKSPIPKPALQNVSISSTSGPSADNVEASVMARFNILKSREDNVKPINPEMVDDECEGSEIMARLNILRSRDKNLKSVSVEDEKQSKMMNDVYATLDEFHLLVPNDPIIHHPFKSNGMIGQNHLGQRDSSSFDWEHVLKDDFTRKNT